MLEGSKLGILDYIAKPFEAQVLKSRVLETFKKMDALSFEEEMYPQLAEILHDLREFC